MPRPLRLLPIGWAALLGAALGGLVGLWRRPGWNLVVLAAVPAGAWLAAGLFVIVLAAAEAAVALAIALNFYNNHLTIDVDRGNKLKG